MFELNRYVEEKERRPMLNYFSNQLATLDLSNYQQVQRKQRLMNLSLRTPELIGMIIDIAEDICRKYQFNSLTRGGKNRIARAKRWTRNVRFKETIVSAIIDYLITGEMYFYMGANAVAIQEHIDKASQRIKDKFLDEDLLNPMFQHIASTTMSVRHDSYNVVGYTQKIASSEVPYSVKEIIKGNFVRVNGKVEGYTPLYSVPLHLELLWLLWTNQHDLQLKGNMPDYIVVAEDIRSNTPQQKQLEQKLSAYNNPQGRKHGITLLNDGKYSFEKMERDTSLQFQEVGQAVTSILAGLYRYPAGRLQIKTEEAAKSKDAPGDGERNYWERISQHQDYLAELLNTQLFEPFFGVEIVFDKGYLHDDVVENTATQLRMNNVNQMNQILQSTHGKRMTEDYLLRVFNNKDSELDALDIEESEAIAEVGSTLNAQLPKKAIAPGMAESDRQTKREEALGQEKNKGKPTGM